MSQKIAAEKIEAARLDTDLMYRFQYVAKFVEFGEKDIAAIKGAASFLAPLVPAVVNAVYTKLFSFDVTKAYFLKRQAGQSEEDRLTTISEELDFESAQIKYRMSMLNKYLVKLVTAEYDEQFIKYLDWVGIIHTNKAGNKSIEVNWVHCNALFTYVEGLLIDAIMAEPSLDHEGKRVALQAFNKLLWIQCDLFARHYVPTEFSPAAGCANAAACPHSGATGGGCPFSGAK